MDPLSAGVNVVAIVKLTEKIGSLCVQYCQAVKHAKHDVERLQGELERLNVFLEGLNRLLGEGPHGTTLQTTQDLHDHLEHCRTHVSTLNTRLENELEAWAQGQTRCCLRTRALKWPFEKKETLDMVQNLKSYREDITACLAVDQSDQINHQTDLIKSQGTLLQSDARSRYDQERLTILEWISSVPYRQHHESVVDSRTPSTCKWLLEHEKFLAWKTASSSTVLWLQGSPGAGKSVLTSNVIDRMESLLETGVPRQGFAFFYCKRDEAGRRDPLTVLRSYLRQLWARVGIASEMPQELRDLYRETNLKGSSLNLEVCRKQLLSLIDSYPGTTLVLDALDECDPESRGRLVETIEFLWDYSKRPLKVFISSRPDGDIRSRFLSRPYIAIQASDISHDIETYVRGEIVRHPMWGMISPALHKDIVETLLARSDGMFQWAFLQIKQLLRLRTEAAIKDRLGKLPEGLTASYKAICDEIGNSNRHDGALAERAFKWVMCAYHPLSRAELLGAVCVDPDSDTTEPTEAVDEDLLLDLCRNLLVLDARTGIWRFSHLSVVEYLEENRWSLVRAHCNVAKSCLRLLLGATDASDECEPNGPDRCAASRSTATESVKTATSEIWNSDYPIWRYVSHFWMKHAHSQECQPDPDLELIELLKTFLGSPMESSSQYRVWFREVAEFDAARDERMQGCYLFSRIPITGGRLRLWQLTLKLLMPSSISVFALCNFSFFNLLRDWWQPNKIDLACKNGEGHNLLMMAALAGCKRICGFILQWQPLEPAGQDRAASLGIALTMAAHYGHAEVIRLLVEHGADTNIQLDLKSEIHEYPGSPLAVAAYSGSVDIIRCLISGGAEVDATIRYGTCGSALAAAARRGNTEAAKFLIENGATINRPLHSGRYGSALAAAATEIAGFETLQFLVGQGADVNMLLDAGETGSAIAGASWQKTVKHLVDHGADVNMTFEHGPYGCAVIAAATRDYTAIL